MAQWRTFSVACLCAVSVLGVARPHAQVSTDSTALISVLQDWISAVKAHAPGRGDGAVAYVSDLSCNGRKSLDEVMGLFLQALLAVKFTKGSLEPRNKMIVDLGRREQLGANAFLKRAAVLHSDAATQADLAGRTTAACEGFVRSAQTRLASRPTAGPTRGGTTRAFSLPIFPTDRFDLAKDGEILGDIVENWNWSFARYLVHLLATAHADDPFVGAWYHATAASQFAQGAYGESRPHLERAAIDLPADPRVLFDRACYAEIMGLPMHQVLIPDEPRSPTTFGVRLPSDQGADGVRVPSGQATNAEAERLFKRALQVDPSFVEARVRLARLLDLRGAHEEAASNLRTALSAKPTGVVAFYAHLFAGRAELSLGHIDDALIHYHAASTLFPDAQSALMGWSQAALMAADIAGAVEPIRHLGRRSAQHDADPWWHYRFGAGRDADGLMRDVWASVPR